MISEKEIALIKNNIEQDFKEKKSEFNEAYGKHFRYEEVELILLKGHLMLEQTLNEGLALFFKNEGDMEQLRLMFDKKLNLLIALRGALIMDLVTSRMKEINRIRNKLTHHLEFDDYQVDLKSWITSILGPTTINDNKIFCKKLADAFSHLIGMMHCLNALQKRNYLIM